ncbi:MAG: MazG nucleotide pyrophosphohydrolase domain-containing protein [Vicinamibacterales bacterium]
MTLDELQTTVDEWIRRTGGGYWGKFEILARLTEELGEVAAALQRSEGFRPRKVDVDLPGELGDLLFTLAAFANVTNTRLDDAVAKTMRKYDDRDGDAWQAKEASP